MDGQPNKPKRRPVDALFGEDPPPQTPPAKRRPVDALFGESTTPTVPSYVVEPPQPVTTVSPPAASSTPPRASASPTAPPPSVPEYARAPALEPTKAAAPAFPSTPAPTFTPEPASWEATGTVPSTAPQSPTSTYARAAVAAPAALPSDATAEAGAGNKDEGFAYLADTIRQLYDDVGMQLSDSPTVAEYCMKLLLQAREAYLKGDYATAEYNVETVTAKLKRSAKSMELSHSLVLWLLMMWEIVVLAVTGAAIAATYVVNLTVFGLPTSAEFIVLMRSVAWGGIGGVIGALYNMPWFLQFREYDPAYNMNYFARPLQGMLVGAVLFLISQAGILAGTVILPGSTAPSPAEGIPVGPMFLYVISAMAGFKQEYVFEFFDSILKMIFRIPQLPTELNVPSSQNSSGTSPYGKQ